MDTTELEARIAADTSDDPVGWKACKAFAKTVAYHPKDYVDLAYIVLETIRYGMAETDSDHFYRNKDTIRSFIFRTYERLVKAAAFNAMDSEKAFPHYYALVTLVVHHGWIVSKDEAPLLCFLIDDLKSGVTWQETIAAGLDTGDIRMLVGEVSPTEWNCYASGQKRLERGLLNKARGRGKAIYPLLKLLRFYDPQARKAVA